MPVIYRKIRVTFQVEYRTGPDHPIPEGPVCDTAPASLVTTTQFSALLFPNENIETASTHWANDAGLGWTDDSLMGVTLSAGGALLINTANTRSFTGGNLDAAAVAAGFPMPSEAPTFDFSVAPLFGRTANDSGLSYPSLVLWYSESFYRGVRTDYCFRIKNVSLSEEDVVCRCPTTFTVAVGREYVAAVTPQRLEVELLPTSFSPNNHYPGGVIVSYASESQAEQFCSDSANYADPVDISAEHFYSTSSPGCSVSSLTRTINSTPTVFGPLTSIVDGSTFWTISSYSITYSCEAPGEEPYAPPLPCVTASGSFVINRKINTCSISQQASESLFTDQVPATAYGTTYSTLANSVASNNKAEIEVDILINKNLFDISPLKTELIKLQAKLNHYNEVLGCKRDSVSSINNFHIMALGNDPNGLANVSFSKPNSPPEALQLGNTPSSSVMAGSEHSVYNYMKNLPETSANLARVGKAAGEAMHLFVADPHKDSKVNYFVIPTKKGSYTMFNPKATAPEGRAQDYFIDQITRYINIVTKKMDKIEKYLEDNHSFCSEMQSVQNSNVKPGYVFQKLNYNVEIEYDVITYSTDCVDKTTASTASKTLNLSNQSFYPDKIITINLD